MVAWTEADDTGYYALAHLPAGDYVAIAQDADYAFDSQPITVVNGASYEVALVAASGKLRGLVTSADTGQPISDVLVTAISKNRRDLKLLASNPV